MGNAGSTSHRLTVECVQSKVLPHWDANGTEILALQLQSSDGNLILLTFVNPEECKLFKEGHSYTLTIQAK